MPGELEHRGLGLQDVTKDGGNFSLPEIKSMISSIGSLSEMCLCT